MPDRTARRYRLRRADDRLGVDAIVVIEVGDRAGLAEMLDAQRPGAMPEDRAEPGERRRVSIENGDQRRLPWHPGQQPLDVALRGRAALTRAAGRGPPGVEP